MFAIGEKSVPQPDKSKTLLDLMIYRGKILYFTDLVLENTPDSVKIKYTSSQLDWCIRNEANIWAFFIEKNILFSKDHETARKFLADGPFTSVFTKNSPARTGEYIGWQIVRTFMKKNPEMSFKDLIKQDAQKILNESSYKPKR